MGARFWELSLLKPTRGITLDHSPEWPGWIALDGVFAVIFVTEARVES